MLASRHDGGIRGGRAGSVLYPALEPLDERHHETIASRVKVMAELDIACQHAAQDGRFRLHV